MKWRKVLHSLWIDIKCIFYWLFLTYLEVTDNLKYTLAGSVTTSELVNLVFNFIEVYSGRTLYPYQEQFSKRVIRSVLTNDGAEITALFARQSGKSETISDTSGGMMILLPQLANMPMFANDKRLQPFRDGLWIGIFAPSQRQAQITYNRIRSRLLSPSAEAVLNDPDFNLQFTTSNGQTCSLSNGSFVTAISASDGSSIEGESFKLIICEECFVKGTPILTEKGKKNIEDVSVGDKVYSYNHSKRKVELKKVQRSFSQPLYGRKIVTITTKSGKKIVCTDNHKIFVPNKNQYVRADHLTKDDFVLSYMYTTQESGEENEPNDFGNTVRGRKYNLSRQKIFKKSPICSKSICKAKRVRLGQISKGETSLSTRAKDSTEFREGKSTLSIYNKVFTRIKRLLQSILCKWKESNKKVNFRFTKRGSISLLVSRRRKFLWNDVYSYARLHSRRKSAISELADGKIQYNSPNKNGQTNKQTIPVFQGERKEQISAIDTTLHNIFNAVQNSDNRCKSSLCSVRKDDIALSQKKGNLLFREMSKEAPKGIYERVLQEEEIESIEIKSVDEIEVFDLTIEDNHNFFADTLLVHNCQDISNYKITKSIHPMGAAYNATKVKIGTATTFKGNFYDAIQRNKLEYDNGETRVRNHFEYDCDVAAKYNPWYAKYIEGEKRSLGEKSDEYQMSYKLKWILERGMFIDIEQFEQNNLEPLLDVSLYDKSRTHVAGIDLGGKGDDTVITIVEVDWTQPLQFDERVDPETGETMVYKTYNTYIKSWLKISNMPDYEEQYYMIMDFLSHFKLAKVVCDATREASISHRLRANLNCEVIPYIFTTKSKSEMYKNLETEISSGRARVPASEEVLKSEEYHKFIEQLGELQKDYRGSQLVVSHPDEKNAHDDFCLSLDTEILTDKGFITYDKMTSDTLVASVVDGKIVYRKPTKIIHKDYCGKMYEFKSKDLDLKVTENHKMLVKHRNSGCYKDMLSQSLFAMPNEQRYNTLQIPVAPIQDKADYPISDELIKQCGWFITEGWINFDKRYNSKRYCFGQSIKSLKYSEIQAMVKKLGLNPYIYTRKDGLTYWVYHKKDNALFDSLLADGIHRIPRKWLNDFSLRQLRLLLDTLMYGDGTITRNTYHTASYDLARDFQELAHKCGIKTSIRKSGEMYNCYLMQGDCTRIKEVNVTDYNGKVWCVNVDNGYIVTRRNDKIAVTGNCDSWGLAVWGCMDEGVVNETETVNRDSLMGKSRNEQSFYRAISGFTARRRR